MEITAQLLTLMSLFHTTWHLVREDLKQICSNTVRSEDSQFILHGWGDVRNTESALCFIFVAGRRGIGLVKNGNSVAHRGEKMYLKSNTNYHDIMLWERKGTTNWEQREVVKSLWLSPLKVNLRPLSWWLRIRCHLVWQKSWRNFGGSFSLLFWQKR